MGNISRKKWSVVTPVIARNDEESGWSSTLSTGPRRIPSQKMVCSNNQLKPRMIEKMKQERKRPRGLPWPPEPASTKGNNHRSPALRWSLLILIMELRKHGLEVGESIY
uniref:Uncharacterized protein n=1 Tax=Fagus sylvatica TaxID=28930 RepID=A0A2N9GP28_FAGSY